LLVYVRGDYGAQNNIILGSLTQTPVSVWGNTSFTLPVYATREVVADVNVFVYPDDRFVSLFNQTNNKKCILFPASSYQLNGNQHTIKAGSFTSDPLTIQITVPSSLKDTNGYVLPLSVTKVEGSDKGVVVSNNSATAYLYIPYAYTNIDSTQVPLAGG